MSSRAITIADEYEFRDPEDRVGEGSFATVFRGRHIRTQREVAVKRISKLKLRGREQLLRNLMTEVDLLKRLRHPHITKLYGTKEDEHYMYLMMEFCDGGDLFDFVKRGGPLAEDGARRFMRQLALALKEVRRNNIVHRDLKPQNLLLRGRGDKAVLKIADFGFARQLASDVMAATMCGTPLYMAPEILSGRSYTASADLWSVGCILYHMLTRVAPFNAPDIETLRRMVKRSELRLPEGIVVSDSCLDVLQRLLQRDPARRISFDDFFAHPWLGLVDGDCAVEASMIASLYPSSAAAAASPSERKDKEDAERPRDAAAVSGGRRGAAGRRPSLSPHTSPSCSPLSPSSSPPPSFIPLSTSPHASPSAVSPDSSFARLITRPFKEDSDATAPSPSAAASALSVVSDEEMEPMLLTGSLHGSSLLHSTAAAGGGGAAAAVAAVPASSAACSSSSSSCSSSASASAAAAAAVAEAALERQYRSVLRYVGSIGRCAVAVGMLADEVRRGDLSSFAAFMRNSPPSTPPTPPPAAAAAAAESSSSACAAEEAMALYVKALSLLGKALDVAGNAVDSSALGSKAASLASAASAAAPAASDDSAERPAALPKRLVGTLGWLQRCFNAYLAKLEDTRRSDGADDAAAMAVCAERVMYDRAMRMAHDGALAELSGDDAESERRYMQALLLLESLLVLQPTLADADRIVLRDYIARLTYRVEELRRAKRATATPALPSSSAAGGAGGGEAESAV
eukprot:PLAT4426.6.p1 GENE.PLAT4426.6~~PLAT4426.6.p1  ORF type:complete len:810 (+),score=296.53 PLAT4426.6:202-2430(+)